MTEDFVLTVVQRAQRIFVQPAIPHPRGIGAQALDFVACGDLDELRSLLEKAKAEAVRQLELPQEERAYDTDGTAPARSAGCRTERQFVKSAAGVSIVPDYEEGSWYLDRLEPNHGGLSGVERREVPLAVTLAELVPIIVELLRQAPR